jgi:hypothetical protein
VSEKLPFRIRGEVDVRFEHPRHEGRRTLQEKTF